jgi:hypothetical protein
LGKSETNCSEETSLPIKNLPDGIAFISGSDEMHSVAVRVRRMMASESEEAGRECPFWGA